MSKVPGLTRLRFLVAACAVTVASSQVMAFEVPALSGPVVDSAGMMDSNAAAALDISLRRLRDSGGPQINVLTVTSLDGMPIETATIQVTDAWKLGGRKEDDGVLLLIALQERRMRIEVGQGLEGTLPDIYAKRIIDDVMTPFFRAGRPSDGIIAGVRAIVEKTAPDKLSAFGDEPEQIRPAKRRGGRSLPLPVLILLMIVIAFMSRRGGGRGGGTGFATGLALGALSGRGGWGGGGGSSGGGSWGGGGGGFSGGGASGGW